MCGDDRCQVRFYRAEPSSWAIVKLTSPDSVGSTRQYLSIANGIVPFLTLIFFLSGNVLWYQRVNTVLIAQVLDGSGRHPCPSNYRK